MAERGSEAPLDRVNSIKVKLGVLVAASVLAAALLATLGANGAVSPWLSIPVAVALALGLTQLLAIGMTAPLREMTAAARRMARGDYTQRVRATSRDEVGDLAAAFNTMAADLATVDRQRRELVATVSHELRTPLTAVGARLENLVDGVEEPTPESLAQVLALIRRLGVLVTDLLDLSRVDAGIRPLNLDSVPLAGLVEESVRDVGPSGREIHYEVDIRPADLTVRIDPDRFRQLLVNLLDNAARHGPAGGSVRITAEAGSELGEWRLCVADDGPGVPPDERERVFERFGTGTATTGGTGFGLAIARWVVDLHGGRIGIVEAPDGVGAVISVQLPQDPPQRQPAQGAGTATETSQPTNQTPITPVSSPVRTAMAQVAARPPVAPQGPSAPPIEWNYWPERSPEPKPLLLGLAALVGVLAGWLWPDSDAVGLSVVLVFASAGLVIWVGSTHRQDWFTIACLALAAGLTGMAVIRADPGLVLLCLFAAVALVLIGVTRAGRFSGLVLAGLAWPLAGLRGLPWLGRTFKALSGRRDSLALVRTALWCIAGVVIFGALFASADALFAQWTDSLLPDLSIDSWVQRGFLSVAVAGVVLAAAYLGLNPPAVDAPLDRPRRPVGRRFEWLAPVLLVDAVFAMFLAAQAAAIFGGRGYVERVTGLTYAEYVHQGFGQFVFATGLTVFTVWLVSRKAAVETVADRAWLRGSLGVLLVFTLVMLASAMVRMDAYFDAFGFSRLRLLVVVFQIWLGLVVLSIIVAGFVRAGGWVTRFAVLSGAAVLLGFAVLNPDAWIARHNLDRFERTGSLDWTYLADLSEDATPVLAGIDDPDLRQCVLQRQVISQDGKQDGKGQWQSWNYSRARSDRLLEELAIAPPDPTDPTASYQDGPPGCP